MAEKQAEKTKPANRPVHELRLGKIKAAIWANDTESGVRHNVTITRLYNDGGKWQRPLAYAIERSLEF